MIFVGLIVSYITPFTGKWYIILNYWNTKLTINSFGILLKGTMCCIDLILSFSARIHLSILGTCSLALARLTHGLPGISFINSWIGKNLPSTCRVVIIKLLLMYYIYISFKYLSIVMAFLSVIWFTIVKIIFWLRKINIVFHLQIIYLLS